MKSYRNLVAGVLGEGGANQASLPVALGIRCVIVGASRRPDEIPSFLHTSSNEPDLGHHLRLVKSLGEEAVILSTYHPASQVLLLHCHRFGATLNPVEGPLCLPLPRDLFSTLQLRFGTIQARNM